VDGERVPRALARKYEQAETGGEQTHTGHGLHDLIITGATHRSKRQPRRIDAVKDATLAMTVARCRMAIGLAAVVSPRLATRAMSGQRASEGMAPLFVRMLGARDVALGLGTVIALDRGAPVRGWVEASALADAADCISCVLARKDLSPLALRASTGLGGASALLGAFLSRRLDPPPPAQPGQPEAVATGH
jgi:hypothetical protein